MMETIKNESFKEGEEITEVVPPPEIIDVKNKDPRWPNPICASWMNKYTRTMGRIYWRRRFFILDRDYGLFYFKTEEKSKPCKAAVKIKGQKFWKTVAKKNAIEIERESKPFIFYGKSLEDVSAWVLALKQAGGKFDQNTVISALEPEVGKLSVSEWSTEHVAEWLAIVPFTSTESYDVYGHLFTEVDGKALLKMNERKLNMMGIKKFAHRKLISRSIRGLVNNKKFNLDYHYVLKKILVMVEARGGKVQRDQIRQLALNLSDPTAMCKSYLSYESIENFGKIKEENSREEEEEVEGEGKKTKEEEEEGENINFDEESENPGSSKPIQKIKKYPVKLVITEIARSDQYKRTRRLLSPIMSQIARFSQEFGMFHTALIVGPWYLEWNNSSLCIPRRIISANALISADIEPIDVKTDVDQYMIAKKVAGAICRWNARKHYDNMNLKKTQINGNCQDFVEDLLHTLGLSIAKDGAFGRFLERMKTRGQCKMEFYPEVKFIEFFKLPKKKKVYSFNTHIELDEFIVKLLNTDIIMSYQTLTQEFATEYRLLKSFDRAFWLRHLKFPLEEMYTPLPAVDPKPHEKYPTGCPFKNPKETKSYM